ncbi:hypothetical protein [Deinococcus marmoris]|uniref:hypothetical protein n=1 Tax=Deinococcus marmoris TaxID=249408 RepID=UPI0011152A38|nr:hypothetical protein [Deinococcus marmoris]
MKLLIGTLALILMPSATSQSIEKLPPLGLEIPGSSQKWEYVLFSISVGQNYNGGLIYINYRGNESKMTLEEFDKIVSKTLKNSSGNFQVNQYLDYFGAFGWQLSGTTLDGSPIKSLEPGSNGSTGRYYLKRLLEE